MRVAVSHLLTRFLTSAPSRFNSTNISQYARLASPRLRSRGVQRQIKLCALDFWMESGTQVMLNSVFLVNASDASLLASRERSYTRTVTCPSLIARKSLMPDWIRSVLSSRTLSLLVAIAYLVIACLAAPSAAKLVASLLIIGGALLLPLACIWFADELGEYVGVLPGPSINRRSPAWMVKIAGWILLLLPVILFLFTYPY
jgi:hypothetical protein